MSYKNFFKCPDRRSDKMRLFNFSHIQCDRLWLQNILVSDSSDTSDEESGEPITEQDLQEMLKLHLYKKKYKKKFYSNPDVSTLLNTFLL